MNLRLAEMPAAVYAELVLPQTHALWGGTRTLESYTQRNLAVSQSPYGKRFFRTYGLFDENGALLASFKRYERTARAGTHPVRAFGIGAVFTPPQQRGAGYATAMLATALDRGRAEGFDAAYLFSDIHPRFYQQLGFAELPSRSISVRADAFSDVGVAAGPIGPRDWIAVRRCFERMEAQQPAAFTRNAQVWNLFAARAQSGDNFAARTPQGIVAYVLGRREPKHDAYIVDEFAFYDAAGEKAIGPMLRSAAGDLRRIAGWLPPAPARGALPRGSVRKRTTAIFMGIGLTGAGNAFIAMMTQKSSADPLWTADHV